MAIEDSEWQGDVEVARSPRAALVAAVALAEPTVTGRRSWVARVRQSVWLEPTLRLLGMALLLSVLAGIGVVANTYVKPGIKLPDGVSTLTDALGSSWLKPSPTVGQAPKPVVLEAPATAPTAGSALPVEGGGAGSPPVGITADGKVILNVASADELTKLPGVGLKRAQAIVALRAKLKRFKHPTDLLRVKGIGPRGLQRMLPHLVLDAPP